jgi:hypothetical protein
MSVEFSKDFADLLSLLIKHQVRYLIVGGYATSIHAVPRYTKDLDVWLEVDRENAERLLDVLRDFGFGSVGLSPEDFLSPGQVVQLGREPNRVDFLTRLKGLEFAQCYSRKVDVHLQSLGLTISVLSKVDLIENKRQVGRLRDLADVEDLENT